MNIAKHLIVALAVVGATVFVPGTPRAQTAGNVVASPDEGSVSKEQLGDDITIGEDVSPAKCRYKGGCVPTITKTVKEGALTLFAAFAEFNPATCEWISAGSWTFTKKPKKGSLSQSTFPGLASSGPCQGHIGTFMRLYYTAKKPKGKDSFAAVWSTSDFPKTCPACQIGVTGKVKIQK